MGKFPWNFHNRVSGNDTLDKALSDNFLRAATDESVAAVAADVDTVTTGLADHLADTTDAHDASAISNIAAGGIAATDVQGAINELDTEKIPYSLADAKGDLLAASGDNVFAKQSAGADGTVLTYDDSAANGVAARRIAVPYSVEMLRAAGATVTTANFDVFNINATGKSMGDGTMYLMAVYLPYDATINGAMWFQNTQGSYTADNNNKVALYTKSGSTYTRVAQSSNDGNLWKGASGTWQAKAFSAQYNATAGLYYVAFLANWSAVSTVPVLGSTANQLAVYRRFDLTLGLGLSADASGQTDMPSSIGPTNDAANAFWAGLY